MRATTDRRFVGRLVPLEFPSSAASSRKRGSAFVLACALLAAALVGVPPVAATAPTLTDFRLHAAFTPDDTFFIDQWGLRSVDAVQAWDVTLGSSNIVVAVVDTGVWWTHADLSANMWTNTDGSHGYDFISGDTDPLDEDVAGGTFHGTGVAGVIAALTDNTRSIAGAAQVSVMALRALDATGSGSSINASQAIRWAADRGARIINLSLGTNVTFGGPTDLQLAVDYAWRRGALIVAAAGNSGAGSIDYPARLPNVVSVAALDETGTRAGYSNYGAGLDISAPGTRILTLTANNQVHYLAGTSMATPFVSGAAALLLSMDPSLTNVDLWNILNETAVPIGSRYNTNYGWGEVNYWNAISALNRPFISVNNFPSRVAKSASFSIGWTILGPGGLTVSDTHVEWGTIPGSLGNATTAQTGMTREPFTQSGFTIPSGASTLFFKVVGVVNGTRYESQERSVAVSTLPDFVQALYDLVASNILFLALFVVVVAAIVALVPARQRARARRAASRNQIYPMQVLGYAPPPVLPIQSPVVTAQPAPAQRSTAEGESQRLHAIAPLVVDSRVPSQSVAPSPPPPPPKKVCPACGTTVSAESVFCFYCGHAFR